MRRDRIRVLALVQRPVGTAPNQRFRHEQWAPHLAADHGIDLAFESFASPELGALLSQPGHRWRKLVLALRDAWRRREVQLRLHDYDAVVVLREASLIGGAWLERAIARSGVPLIYDFDDAIWLTWPLGANGMLTLARHPWKVASICRMAAAVTVGNEFLAAYARRHNSDVHIVRTSVELARFPVYPQPPQEDPFTVVWTGSSTTLQCLETARDMLEALGRTRPVRLRVVCDVAPAPFENVELEFIPWTPAAEAAELAPGHVGIMPLFDSELTNGKCGCKALQYMAIGRPVVVSPVGVNTRIVTPGVNGYWADSDREWLACLERLADDETLRRRMGAAARATVEAGFRAEDSAARFAEVVRGVVGRAGRTAVQPPAPARRGRREESRVAVANSR